MRGREVGQGQDGEEEGMGYGEIRCGGMEEETHGESNYGASKMVSYVADSVYSSMETPLRIGTRRAGHEPVRTV